MKMKKMHAATMRKNKKKNSPSPVRIFEDDTARQTTDPNGSNIVLEEADPSILEQAQNTGRGDSRQHSGSENHRQRRGVDEAEDERTRSCSPRKAAQAGRDVT